MDSAISQDRSEVSGRQGSVRRCPECGASNKSQAQWCNQCLTKFAPPAPPAAAAPKASAASPAGDPVAPEKSPRRVSGEVTQAVGAGSVTVAEDGISWTCARCDSTNDLEENVCGVCGARFADAIRPEQEPRPARDANMAALISLFMPGAGHAYLGMWGEALARGVISTWVVMVAIFAAAQGAPQAKVMAVLFALVGTALWMVGAHDAFREASDAPGAVILKRRFFLYLVLGLLTLSIVLIFSTVLGART